MASPYVLSNFHLQHLASTIPSRFKLTFAVFDVVAFTVTSNDLIKDANGAPTPANNVDLCQQKRAPYAPQPNLGPNRIGFVGEPLVFDGSRSTQRGNLPAVGHGWAFNGAPLTVAGGGGALGGHPLHGGGILGGGPAGAAPSPSGATWTSPDGSVTVVVRDGPYAPGGQVVCTYSRPGIYTVALTVQDRYGGVTTGVRQVAIYADRASAPAAVTGLASISGGVDAGGFTVQLTTAAKLLGVPLPDALPIGSYLPVAILAETEYETSPGQWRAVQVGPYANPVPGQHYEDGRILFSGYLASGAAAEDHEKDTMAYTFQTVDLVAHACGIHTLGYYNTVAKTTRADGVTPATLDPTKAMDVGQLADNLTSEDVYRSLLLDHSTLGLYHDVFLWRDYLPQQVPAGLTGQAALDAMRFYWPTYSGLTAPEGAIWDALTAVAQNEFAQVYCERDSSIRVGPRLNMRGYELLSFPTVYSPLLVANIQNLSAAAAGLLAGQRTYLHFLWGPNALPTAADLGPGSAAVRDLSAVLGPPVAYHLSDIPIYDPAPAPPADPNLFPWVLAAWPQDLSIRPTQLQVSETYTGKAAFLKLTMVAPLLNNQWTAWYPSDAFDSAGNPLYQLPAGQWNVIGAGETSVLPDVTIQGGAGQRALVWQYLWEICRRQYRAQNASYAVQAVVPAAPYARLGDLMLVTRQRALDGPRWTGKPFQVSQIAHSIDLSGWSWQTQLDGVEVTTYGLTSLITPPFAAPADG